MTIKHTMTRTPLILVLLAVLALSCQKSGQTSDQAGRVLRIGTDATYPPFETVNTQTGRPEGFDIDLITAICEVNGWKPEFIVTPFDGMIPGLQGGKYDAAISAMTITPQRQEVVAFSNPYYSAGQIIAVPLSDNVIKTPDHLKGKRVGVQLGTTGEMMARQIEGATIISFDNIGAAFIDMENGNLDAVLNDYPTTRSYIQAHGSAKMVGSILSKENYGIAMRKEDTALVAAVNRALAQIKGGSRYRDLHMKWFDTPPPDESGQP